MPVAARRILAVAIVMLCIVGVFAAIQRSRDVLSWPPPGELSPIMREQVEQTAEVMGLAAGSAGYRELEAFTRLTLRKFHEHPVATMLHMAPGAIVLAFAPLQFSPAIRRRWPSLHRWSGRFLLSMAALAAASGFFFGFATPFGGALEASAVAVFGALFVFAAGKGWVAIRRGDRAAHREWMIRMFAVAVGIAVIRVGMVATLAVTGWAVEAFTPAAFAAALWIGWLATVAAAELWIRATRGALPREMRARKPA